MNKEDILYKLSQGTCTAVWAHDEIRRQSKRIAELEATLESVNECFGELYVKKQIEKIKEQDE